MFFYPVTRDKPCVVAGTTSNYMYSFDLRQQLCSIGAQGSIEHAAIGDALLQSLCHRMRLLVDLFLHVVPEVTTLRGIGGKLTFDDLAFDRLVVAGVGEEAKLHKEPLDFEDVKLTQRSYK